MDRLKGKVAIVTARRRASAPAGVRRFAEEGARVVVADLNGKGGRAYRQRDRQRGDLGSRGRVAARRCRRDGRRGVHAFGRVDVMVNNAGYHPPHGDMLKVDEETFDLITAVNMKAVYHAARAVVPVMEKQGGGVILTPASTAGLRPRPGLTWYNASKGWAITATKSMAVELAPKNIRVNCLCPVAGDTGMLERFMGADTPEIREKFRASIPLGRLSTPLDIANAALWLASEEAAFITGVALEVDGGRCI